MTQIRLPSPEEIIAARKAAGDIQKTAAEKVYVSKRQWQNYEWGIHDMPVGLWELYCLKTDQRQRLRSA